MQKAINFNDVAIFYVAILADFAIIMNNSNLNEKTRLL